MDQTNVESVYSLTPSQQGMLIETLSADRPGMHIEQAVWHLSGELNREAFEKAWETVIDRHTMFRTAFAWRNLDEPVQIVLKRIKLSLEWRDLRPETPARRDEIIRSHVEADRSRGFPLNQPPLFRIAIFQTAERDYQAILTHHHILMDGWSMAVVQNEIIAGYGAYLRNTVPHLDSSRPYRDYIGWLKRQDLADARRYWKTSLAGFSRPTPAGLEAPGGEATGPRYGECRAGLSIEETRRLRELSRKNHVTMSSLIQGLWAILIGRYNRCEDVVFGATVSGRPAELSGVDSMIGLFINTVPRRFHVLPESPFWPWVVQSQFGRRDEPAYEYCGAGQIQSWSDVPGGTPLYESIVVFENYPERADPDSADMLLNPETGSSAGARTRYALTILVQPSAELGFQAVFDRTRYASADAEKILNHLAQSCRAVLSNPDIRVRDAAPIMTDAGIPKIRAVSALRPAYQSPRTDVEVALVHIWESLLDVKPVGVRDNFFDLGGHSLLAVPLMGKIRDMFAKKMPLSALFQNPTVERLAAAVRKETGAVAWSPIVLIQPNGEKPPLFCVHPGGGAVLCFYDLAKRLPSDRPFCGVQAYGIEDGQTPKTTVGQIARFYIESIRAVQPDGPYHLAGWSFGGIVAFEIARLLETQGARVALLAILDTHTPLAVPPEEKSKDSARLLVDIFGHDVPLAEPDLRALTLEGRLAHVTDKAKSAGIFPPDFSLKDAVRLWNLFMVNRTAGNEYVPPRYPGRVTLFKSSARDDSADPTLGWNAVATNVDVIEIPGNHLTMIREPNVKTLSEKMEACLSASMASAGIAGD